jgi:hypothetical protein
MGILAATLLVMQSMIAACTTTATGGSANEAVSATKFTTEDDFRQWFAFYYKDPKPQELTAALRFMKERNYLKDYPDVAAAFLSRIFEKTPERLDGWMAEWRGLGAEEWDVILAGLYFANTDATHALYEKQLERGSQENHAKYRQLIAKGRKHADLLAMDVAAPRQVNLMWAAYSASGDERFVRKVIGLIGQYGEESRRRNEIGEAAIMTLANSALVHEQVATICLEENKANADPKTRALLKTMLQLLAQIAKEEGLPSH